MNWGRRSWDGIILGLAIGVFLIGLGAVIRADRDPQSVPPIEGVTTDVSLPSVGGEESDWSAPVIWSDPIRSPDDWGFDVFTPPVIYYDRSTARFSIAPPEQVVVADVEPLADPLGITLLAVNRHPFRLQLVGYAGTVETPWGIFADELSGEGMVAKAGHRFETLGLELMALSVHREDLTVPDSMPLREIVAVAELRDVQSGETVRLSSAQTAWSPQQVARVRVNATGEMRRVRAGDHLQLETAIIEILDVNGSPESIAVVQHFPDGTRETARVGVEMLP